MATTTRSKKKKQPLGATIANRQTQMIRLLQRYASLVYDPAAFIFRYCWKIGYIDLDTKEVLQFENYGCFTNNAAFAAMIFESENLPSKISIISIEFVEQLA